MTSPIKPLKRMPGPEVGYSVERRPDGGMHFTFRDVKPATMQHWRELALEHLYDSDRLTRNLYDLRALAELPEAALQYAVEVNSDPSVRNVRLAVVVASPQVQEMLQRVADLTPGGVEMAVFTDMQEAETWLDRPLTLLV